MRVEKTVTMRDLATAMRATGVPEAIAGAIKDRLGAPRVLRVPREVVAKVGVECASEGRAVVTYNASKKHWRVYAVEGYKNKIACMKRIHNRAPSRHETPTRRRVEPARRRPEAGALPATAVRGRR